MIALVVFLHVCLYSGAATDFSSNFVCVCSLDHNEAPDGVLLNRSIFNISRTLNLSRCAIEYHSLGLNGATNQLTIINCLDIGLKIANT